MWCSSKNFLRTPNNWYYSTGDHSNVTFPAINLRIDGTTPTDAQDLLRNDSVILSRMHTLESFFVFHLMKKVTLPSKAQQKSAAKVNTPPSRSVNLRSCSTREKRVKNLRKLVSEQNMRSSHRRLWMPQGHANIDYHPPEVALAKRRPRLRIRPMSRPVVVAVRVEVGDPQKFALLPGSLPEWIPPTLPSEFSSWSMVTIDVPHRGYQPVGAAVVKDFGHCLH